MSERDSRPDQIEEAPILPTAAVAGHGGEYIAVPTEAAPARRLAPSRLAVAAAGSRPVGWMARRVVPPDRSLLRDEAFRFWWLTRFFSQVAQGALLYALLIIVVDRTDASIYSSLFVVCSILPSLLFG